MGKIDPKDEDRRMKEAADIIRDEARRISSSFSRRIPAATHTRQGPRYTEVVTDGNAAPNAAPFEFAENHPLFARKGTKRYRDSKWYKQPHRPFMAEAVDAKKDDAVAKAAEVVNDWMHDLGYERG
jgi:hypothetical protein